MASAQAASEVFGQMKKQTSSSSQNEEWPGARKHRHWLRWAAALTLGLAVAAGVSIPLDEKISKSSDENLLAASTTAGSPISEEATLENDTPTPFPEPRPTSASSGEIQRKWDVDTQLNVPNQGPPVESSTVPTEAQGEARRENTTPAQGSDNTNGEGGGSADIRTSPQQAMLEMPQAPAVGRIPPVRPLPTPIPTPPPIRSPQ
jgi:hypothetical protein